MNIWGTVDINNKKHICLCVKEIIIRQFDPNHKLRIASLVIQRGDFEIEKTDSLPIISLSKNIPVYEL